MRISKTELAVEVNNKLKKLPDYTTKDMIDAVIESITDILAKGDSISFNNFGTFEIKEKVVKKKNPDDENAEEISNIKKSVSFKMSKIFKDQLNPED